MTVGPGTVALVLLVACDPGQGPERTTAPPPVYLPCEALGDQRYQAAFCVHAERVRVEDVPIALCDEVRLQPSTELLEALDGQVRERIAREHGWRASDVELTQSEAMSVLATLDVCVRQFPWTEEARRWRSEALSSVSLDTSRAFRTEVIAARNFSFRGSGRSAPEPAELGAWPEGTGPPPIRWLGYPRCEALPPRFTSARFCVHAEGVRVLEEPFALCDRVTVIPSERLRRAIRARVVEHLRVGDHADARFVDVDEEGAEPVVTVEACVAVPDAERRLQASEAPTHVRGGIDADRPLAVEVEQAQFRYRFGAEGAFQVGSIGREPREGEP